MQREEKLDAEKETESYDQEAMRKLSYVLVPLILVGAVYQLLFSSYKRLVIERFIDKETQLLPSLSLSLTLPTSPSTMYM